MSSLMASIFSDVPGQESHPAHPPGGAPGTGGEALSGGLYVPSPLPRGLCWWPEHPLEALGIQDPLGKSAAGKPDAKRPAGGGGVRQARPWGRSVGLSARPQVSSRPASEDAASCSDSSSLLGLGLVGDWVSRAANGAGLRARPAHSGGGFPGAAEATRARPGWARGGGSRS